MIKSTLLFAAIAVAFVFGACKSTTEPSGTTIHVPGVGSVFTFVAWDIDSLNRYTADTGTLGFTVLGTALSYQGKTNVVQFNDQLPEGENKMVYANYEPNGNLSIYDRDHWTEIPIATKAEITTSWADTNAPNDITKRAETYTYTGTENITLAGHTFSAVKIDYSYRYWTNGVEYSDGSVVTYWFAPETGWFVQFVNLPYLYEGRTERGFKMALNSYTLK